MPKTLARPWPILELVVAIAGRGLLRERNAGVPAPTVDEGHVRKVLDSCVWGKGDKLQQAFVSYTDKNLAAGIYRRKAAGQRPRILGGCFFRSFYPTLTPKDY